MAIKAVFVLWTLWETEYIDVLMTITTHLNDSQRGWLEGRIEATGDVNTTLTPSTNATVLEALFYKHNTGLLFKNGLADDNNYFAHRVADEFNPPRRYPPGERVIRSIL